MKKVISLTVAAAMLAAVSGAALAEAKTPTVYVNTSQIYFEDQEPVILGEGTTLVPARGVFEAMGAKVDWDGEKRQVEVRSSDNKTFIRLVIDDNDMKVYDMTDMFSTLLAGQDWKAPETVVTLEVAPQILNDRTMIPLRAISEALDAKVDWDGENYNIDITTANQPAKDGLPAFSLSASADTVSEGEEFDIYVNLKNLPAEKFVSSVSAIVSYDPENFEFVSSALVKGDEAVEGALGADNAEYEYGEAKAVYVTIDADKAATADGKVLKLTFKSLTGKAGSFALVNSYDTLRGYNTSLLVDEDKDESQSVMYDGVNLFVDTTPVTIGASDVPAATAEPTAAPAETAEPEATEAPEATAEPEATEAPAETAEPTATPAA